MNRNVNRRSLWLALTFMILVAVNNSFAANTPWWWNNPTGISNFHRVVDAGSAFNNTIYAPGEAHQAQLVTVVIDVPNLQDPNLSKDIWAQVEWTITGSGEFNMSDTGVPIWWSLDPAGCPASPLDPYPTVNVGSGYLSNEGFMTPLNGFQNGNEFSYSSITPQPPCERINFHFIVGPNSRIDYRVEIQTICLSFDWGDAPDNPQIPGDYPTLALSLGAMHVIRPDFHIAALIDHEGDGQPSLNADGDDLDADGDDEDGLPGTISLTVGQPVSLTIPVIAPAGVQFTLNGWIDFNGDSDWNDAGEMATAAAVGNGATPVNVLLNFSAIPANAIPLTFARLRVASNAAEIATPGSAAHDGEVEDHPVTIAPEEPVLDFGDAPDNPQSLTDYPTLLSSDGARHTIVRGLSIGTLVDPEPDGQPSINAIGDDNDADGDDEDGWNGIIQIVLGQQPSVTLPIIAPAGAMFYLSGWIDINGDGDWNDTGEFAWTSGNGNGLTPVNTTLNFTGVPAGMFAQSYARFRLSMNMNSIQQPTGLAPDGEVEDHPVTVIEIIEDTDWGDAPDPLYPTTSLHNGANHIIVPGLFMGYDIDSETDGVPSIDAQGDDIGDSRDDEDGIDPSTLQFTENQSRSVTVMLHTPSAMTVYVTGWVDYNGNGTWEAFEQAPVQSWSGSGTGSVMLSFPVIPPGSSAITNGQTFARFRLSTDITALAAPTGQAIDGEVEDYRVTILVPVELSLFTAVYENNSIRLNWTTQSETENLGFHIYRSESASGEYTRITSALIPGAGTSERAHYYQHVDVTIEPGKTYFYKLADIDFNGGITYHGPVNVQSAPKNFGLEQNYPNPFNPQTTISYQIKAATDVQLDIYNMRGQKVRTLVSKTVTPGNYSSMWDGRDDSGQLMPSGTYIYKLRTQGFEESRKMELLK